MHLYTQGYFSEEKIVDSLVEKWEIQEQTALQKALEAAHQHTPTTQQDAVTPEISDDFPDTSTNSLDK
ncbi:MAG: hypothetical protein H6765_11255 [Candidatus Peribacteria bacterium]|nr:MAG: hypothetical protein H6765_11255 [Candidatus Peribacteria bacterium]